MQTEETEKLEEDDQPMVPPTLDRVIRRAHCLSALVCRSFIDEPGNEECLGLQSRINTWLAEVGAEHELELWEADCINADLGTLDPQIRVNATWTSEGLAVLAWALDLFDLPSHDECVDPQQVSAALDFLHPEAAALHTKAQLKSPEEIENAAARAFAIHWRLRQFSLASEPLNFAEFANTAWFGPLNIENVALKENDLALDGQPIAKAPADMLRLATSIARERHQAFNWLLGYAEIYSEVDTST